MAFLQLKNVSLAYADRDLLKNVNFSLQDGQKIALTGANGSGKSTLLKLLAHVQEADSGEVIQPHTTKVAYLPQSGILSGTGTVYEEAELAFEPWKAMEEEIHALSSSLENLDSVQSEKALLKLHEKQEALLESGYYSRRETVEQTLKGLGFRTSDLERPAASFSGGWQMRIALSKCLLGKPHLLLLDEPTNYLDLEAKDWLEHFLRNSEGGYLLVSHDRGFLDATVTEVVEIMRGTLTTYKGNYSQYETRRKAQIEQLEEAYRLQQAEIEKTEEYINRFRAKATKAAGVQSRIKMLEKIERIELPESLTTMHFSFPPATHSGKISLELIGLQKSYGTNHVIKNLDFTLLRGEKIALAGRNGAGKSTLMRILAAKDPDFQGTVKWGSGVQTAYFSQDHEKDLDPQKTVLEEVEDHAPTALYPRLRDLLGAFLFRGDDVFKKTAVLSGGEKNRLTLVKLLLKPSNLLLLDEPTNHLDLASKDVLLEALLAYEGAVLVVSHDKYFLSKLSQKVLELAPGGHRLYLGGWEEYLEKMDREVWNDSERTSADAPKTIEVSSSQKSREEAKRLQALERKLQREEEALLSALEKLETEATELNAALSSPEVYTDGKKAQEVQRKLTQNEADQTAIQEKWEAVSRELESLKA